MSPFKYAYIERINPYSKDEIDYFENLINISGWFTNVQFSNIDAKEYPDG